MDQYVTIIKRLTEEELDRNVERIENIRRAVNL